MTSKPTAVAIKKKQIKRGKYKKNLYEINVNGKKHNLLSDVDLKDSLLKKIKRTAKERKKDRVTNVT